MTYNVEIIDKSKFIHVQSMQPETLVTTDMYYRMVFHYVCNY